VPEIWTCVRGEPALRPPVAGSGWLQLEPVLQRSCCEPLRAAAAVPARQLAAPRHRPWGAKAACSNGLRTNQMALVGTRLHRRAAAPSPGCNRWAAALQERLSAGRTIGRSGLSAGSRLEGEEEEGPWRDALAEQLRQPTQRELPPRPVPGGPHSR